MDNLGGLFGLLCGCLCPFIILVPYFAGLWKIFEKAGRPGWEALVPVYNFYVLAIEICKLEMMIFILLFVPVAGIYAMFVISMEMAKRFGKEQGYAIGLLLLPIIFYPMLGFSDARYDGSRSANGGGSRGGSGRSRRRDDEYEDE